MHQINLRPVPRQWLEASVLRPFSAQYLEHLHRARYTPSTTRVYLCCIAHFAHWITAERLALDSIDEAVRSRFLGEHLPVCDCPYPVRRLPHELRAALTHFLDVLRAEDAVPRAGSVTEHDSELRSEEHTSELQSLMRISYAVFCL